MKLGDKMDSFIEKLQDIIKEVTSTDTIEITDIPNIDLYMDQVTTFMEESLKSYKRYSDDKVLTKTMINNYAKAKLFPAPVKKKYTRNHIMLLVIIYHLKSILSINDINKLLKPVTEDLKCNEKSESLETVYRYFVSLQKFNKENILINIDKQKGFLEREDIAKLKNKEEIVLLLTVLLVAIQANTEKRIAEKIIDTYF